MAKRHSSALKRVRQNQRRRERNRVVRSRVRTQTRKVREAIATHNTSAAEQELRAAIKEISQAGSKAVLHRNTVSRRIARLSRQVATLTPQTG